MRTKKAHQQLKFIFLVLATVIGGTSSLTAQCNTSNRQGVHVVQRGETLYRISKRYNISVNDLRARNGMQSNSIFVCQELNVGSSQPSNYNSGSNYNSASNYNSGSNYNSNTSYNGSNYDSSTTEKGGGDSSYNPYKPYSSYQKQAGGKHVMMKGETLANIARLYGYTEEHFRKFNNLHTTQNVNWGTVLKSSDCSCDRATYSDSGKGQGTTGQGGVTKRFFEPKVTSRNTGSGEDDFGGYYKSGNNNTSTPKYNRSTSGGRTSTASSSGASYLKPVEREMIDEINLLRSNPAGYIPFVQDYIKEIEAGRAFSRSTTAAYELIDELRRTGPLSILEPTECIYRAAEKHGQEAVRIGSSDHVGKDGSWPWDRVRRECSQMSDGNENLVGGPDKIRVSMLLLLIDDGIPTRGHRKTLLEPKWKYVACYKSGQVGRMPNSWIQKFGV